MSILSSSCVTYTAVWWGGRNPLQSRTTFEHLKELYSSTTALDVHTQPCKRLYGVFERRCFVTIAQHPTTLLWSDAGLRRSLIAFRATELHFLPPHPPPTVCEVSKMKTMGSFHTSPRRMWCYKTSFRQIYVFCLFCIHRLSEKHFDLIKLYDLRNLCSAILIFHDIKSWNLL